MRLRITLAASVDEQLKQRFLQNADKVEQEQLDDQNWQVVRNLLQHVQAAFE